MEKVACIVFRLLFLLLLVSCQKSDFSIGIENNDELEAIIGITDSSFVNRKMAMRVAENPVQLNTRSYSQIVDNFITLFNDQKEPVIYVANYEDNTGYIMISATKNYHPILMKADNGKFALSNLPEVALWYINTYKANIESLKNAPFL